MYEMHNASNSTQYLDTLSHGNGECPNEILVPYFPDHVEKLSKQFVPGGLA